MMPVRARFPLLLLSFLCASLFAACAKSTIKPGHTDPGFSLETLRTDTVSLSVSRNVEITAFEKSFAGSFASGDSLALYLSQRILDSLNHGEPQVPARAASETTPEKTAPFQVRVSNITIGNFTRELPTMVLPTAGDNSMAPAGGGTSEYCTVAFDVEVWEADPVLGGSVQDSLRASFGVSAQAQVVLYAYKTALIEAVNAAARRAAWQLRGNKSGE